MGDIKKAKHGPEWHIQKALILYMQDRGWLVEVMHGNLFQRGVPDLYAHHPKWGSRWIDCKNPGKYNFTKDQKRKWPIWDSFGVGIYILTGASQAQYDKLFGEPNWKDYWKASWGHIPTTSEIDAMLDEINREQGFESDLI